LYYFFFPNKKIINIPAELGTTMINALKG